MMHQATLAYDKCLIQRAALAFVWHTCGLGFVIAVVFIATALAWLLSIGDYSWFTGSLASCLLFAVAMAAALYVTHYRSAMVKLTNMGTPLAGLVVEDATFSITTGISRNTLRWAAITAVWCLPGFWMCFFSKAQFFIIPLASVSPEMQAFMRVRVQAAGASVTEKTAVGVGR